MAFFLKHMHVALLLGALPSECNAQGNHADTDHSQSRLHAGAQTAVLLKQQYSQIAIMTVVLAETVTPPVALQDRVGD